MSKSVDFSLLGSTSRKPLVHSSNGKGVSKNEALNVTTDRLKTASQGSSATANKLQQEKDTR